MKAKISFLYFFIALFVCNLNAQQLETSSTKIKDTSSIGELALYDLKQSVKSVGHAFSRPFFWDTKDFTTLGTVIVGSLALSTIDDEASAFFVRNEPHVPELFQEAGTRFGSPQVYFITNATLYGVGLFTKNENLRKTSVLIISSSFTSGLIQSFSKTAFGRVRPGNGYKSTEFRFWSGKPAFHSFPSGHTVLSVTMAHAIAKQFDNTWSKVAVYSLGAVAPISRLFAGAHWLTDIGVSTVLSIVVVDSIDKFLFKDKAYNYPKKEKQISWNFTFSGNRIGLIGRF
ncbi:phosphatase PAP2 family protein [Sabulilitoribacter multivorans]|uniref:Phosphatase PAP2 family protein n=1 Tax=Flaviramulus multivorans TaxID=1304750 RepID=A0ABS9IGW5_9FLAO|nr:phosphatase PAP2 family protein [Flaviramulus multivorans]MCF7559999.1 phosphatase PAP2 family protein [Flaviramulus multivorans]